MNREEFRDETAMRVFVEMKKENRHALDSILADAAFDHAEELLQARERAVLFRKQKACEHEWKSITTTNNGNTYIVETCAKCTMTAERPIFNSQAITAGMAQNSPPSVLPPNWQNSVLTNGGAQFTNGSNGNSAAQQGMLANWFAVSKQNP